MWICWNTIDLLVNLFEVLNGSAGSRDPLSICPTSIYYLRILVLLQGPNLIERHSLQGKNLAPEVQNRQNISTKRQHKQTRPLLGHVKSSMNFKGRCDDLAH